MYRCCFVPGYEYNILFYFLYYICFFPATILRYIKYHLHIFNYCITYPDCSVIHRTHQIPFINIHCKGIKSVAVHCNYMSVPV